MHILVATDGSAQAIDTIRKAAGWFPALERVTLLRVFTRVPAGDIDDFDEFDEPLFDPEQQSRQWNALVGEATAGMAHMSTVFAPAVKVDTRIEGGEPARTVAEVARDIEADVIVVGKRMHKRLQRLAHRSIVDRVIREASCAVLVIPET